MGSGGGRASFRRACAILKISCAFVRHRARALIFDAEMRVGLMAESGVVRAVDSGGCGCYFFGKPRR